MKRTQLKRGRRRTLTAEEREQAHRFHEAAQGRPCAMCGFPAGPTTELDSHHCVAAQELRNRNLSVYDVRNVLPLHRLCHGQHESGFARVPFRKLRAENIAYAYEVLGDFASDYLRRRYPMDETEEQT